MKALKTGLLAAVMALTCTLAFANIDSKRADLKEDVTEQLTKAKKELAHYRDEVRDEGNDVKAEQTEALNQLETKVSELEGSLSKIDTATETDWKSVKADVEKSRQELRVALKRADDKID